MEVLPRALVNAKVPNHKKEHFEEYAEIAEAIAEVEAKFAGRRQSADPSFRNRAFSKGYDRGKRPAADRE